MKNLYTMPYKRKSDCFYKESPTHKAYRSGIKSRIAKEVTRDCMVPLVYSARLMEKDISQMVDKFIAGERG